MTTNEGEMITLSQAQAATGVPIRLLRYYAQSGKIWARKETSPRGDYWLTTRQEAERAKRFYRPQKNPSVKKK